MVGFLPFNGSPNDERDKGSNKETGNNGSPDDEGGNSGSPKKEPGAGSAPGPGPEPGEAGTGPQAEGRAFIVLICPYTANCIILLIVVCSFPPEEIRAFEKF